MFDLIANEEDFNRQLNTMLNLNSPFQGSRLINNRKAAIATVKNKLNHKQGSRTKADIQKLIKWVQAKNPAGMFKPFYGAMSHYLEKKL